MTNYDGDSKLTQSGPVRKEIQSEWH